MIDQALARPIVVDQLLLETGLLEDHLARDAGDLASIGAILGERANPVVVGLGTAIQRRQGVVRQVRSTRLPLARYQL